MALTIPMDLVNDLSEEWGHRSATQRKGPLDPCLKRQRARGVTQLSDI